MADAGDDLQMSMRKVIGAGQEWDVGLWRCQVNLSVEFGVTRIGEESAVQILGGSRIGGGLADGEEAKEGSFVGVEVGMGCVLLGLGRDMLTFGRGVFLFNCLVGIGTILIDEMESGGILTARGNGSDEVDRKCIQELEDQAPPICCKFDRFSFQSGATVQRQRGSSTTVQVLSNVVIRDSFQGTQTISKSFGR